MQKLFFLYLAVQLIYFLFTKPSKRQLTQLYCGLFGGCFNREIDETIVQKLKMIGLFNQQRGKDSCGYFNGEEIYKGVDKDKEFFDFVVRNGIVLPEKKDNNLFIGHTRQASVGLHTADNAHPFHIKNVDEPGKKGKDLILAHNGTIKDIWGLCNKHGVNSSKIFVDSLALGCIMLKVGPSVLNEYKGAAALLMHRTAEKGVLYVYHGASRETKDGVEIEERPLYWLQTKEGVYVSSMKNALEFIGAETEDIPEIVPYNKIFKIKNGKLQKKPVYCVDRGDVNIPIVYNYSGNSNYGRNASEDDWGECGYYPGAPRLQAQKNLAQSVMAFSRIPADSEIIDITMETIPPRAWESRVTSEEDSKDYVYYHKGRYYQASTCSFAEGELIIDRKTGVIIPSDMEDSKRPLRVAHFYFIKGIMLKEAKDYYEIEKQILKKEGRWYNIIVGMKNGFVNFAKTFSEVSRYPVTNIGAESINVEFKDKKLWFINTKLAGEKDDIAITPVFSDRNYHFKMGRLIKLVSADLNDKVLLVQNSTTSMVKPPVKEEEVKSIAARKEYSQEVKDASLHFDKIYYDVKELMEGYSEVAMDALRLYCEELATDVFNADADNEVVDKIMNDFIVTSVEKNVSIRSLLLPILNDIELHIEDAINESEDDTEIVGAEDVVENSGNIDEMIQRALSTKDKGDESLHLPVEEEEEDIKKQDQLVEDSQASDKSSDIFKALDHLVKIANDLQLLNNSEMAKDISESILKGVDEMKGDVVSHYHANKCTEAAMQIKKVNSNI